MVTTLLAALTLVQTPGIPPEFLTGTLAKPITWKAEVDLKEAMDYFGEQGISVVYRESAFAEWIGRRQAFSDGTTKTIMPKVRLALTERPVGEAMLALALAYDARWEKIGATYVLVPDQGRYSGGFGAGMGSGIGMGGGAMMGGDSGGGPFYGGTWAGKSSLPPRSNPPKTVPPKTPPTKKTGGR